MAEGRGQECVCDCGGEVRMEWEGVWLGMYVCGKAGFGMVLFVNEVSSPGIYRSFPLLSACGCGLVQV